MCGLDTSVRCHEDLFHGQYYISFVELLFHHTRVPCLRFTFISDVYAYFFSSFYIHNKTWKVINIFVFVVFSYICHQWRKQKEKNVENNKCKTQVVYLDSLYDSHVISSVLYYLSPSNLLLSEPSYNPFSLYIFFWVWPSSSLSFSS